jgi:phosphocarrier protein HPr
MESLMEQTRTVRIVNRAGLHARPASEFVKLAGRYSAEVWLHKDGVDVNGKSILGVLMLAAEHGSEVTIRAVGDDAGDAVEALAGLVARGFEED